MMISVYMKGIVSNAIYKAEVLAWRVYTVHMAANKLVLFCRELAIKEFLETIGGNKADEKSNPVC